MSSSVRADVVVWVWAYPATGIVNNHKTTSRIEHHAAVQSVNLGFDNCFDPFLTDRSDEGPVIALILVGILDRELADRVVKGSA